MRIWLAAYLAVTVMLVSAALAVPFSSSSSPSTLAVNQTAQLLNFTVQNTGSVNITHLNITLPGGFTFSSSSTTTTSPYTSSSSAASWSNSSSIGIVGNGATQYFSVYVFMSQTLAAHGFNVSVADANGVFNSTNVSVSVTDTTPPTYSSNTTAPSSNTTYARNQTYWFNITWTDNGDISKVLAEHNFTGGATPHNDTMSNSSSVYYLKLTDLGAGTYVWRVYANDTNNTVNSTPQLVYTISKGVNLISVYLNGTLNGNITSTNNTAVNITVTTTCDQSSCSLSVSRDGTSIASGASSPYTKSDDVISSVGMHSYLVTAAGNANFTTNTSTYHVATLPSFSVSTTTPLTFDGSMSYINITFNSNPAIAKVFIQGDWSGAAANYTTSNTSTTLYSYNIALPAGTFNWKLFGNYSDHPFNITHGTFTVNKASPTVLLNITPDWTLDSPVQTNVTCTVSISALTPTLYRNNSLLGGKSDVQTFAAGTVADYLCNNTVNQNYTAATLKNTLTIRAAPKSNLQFIDAPSLIEVTQNTTGTFSVKVKNTGNVGENVTLRALDIGEGYSVSPGTNYILVGQTREFNFTFSAGNMEPKELSGTFNASSKNSTTSQTFKLRILPSNETKSEIKDKISLFTLEISKLESSITLRKSSGVNVLDVEAKVEELKAKLQEAENNVDADKYLEAYQSFQAIDSLISETRALLEAVPESGGITNFSRIWIFAGIGAAVVIIGILVYLFLPPKTGYNPQTKDYSWSGKAEDGKVKKGLVERIKEMFSKLFKREPKAQPGS